ncbi:hypothetical protein FKG94_07980 [Exilibacterium tricleocarpae]|uniref:Uncharacterized protein n=1 Tax=Exilibacterium tricleocarpae TaxID=2591008 RepID=A0A545TZM4_9GAMM|nr:hypothetical protein [Exilibacterium tricleocarpae]TQV82657.1 hypothetical protein FKG94_07980 [Exilibacterium tricleocarpae]
MFKRNFAKSAGFKNTKLALVIAASLTVPGIANAGWCDDATEGASNSGVIKALLKSGCKAGIKGATGPVGDIAKGLVKSFLVSFGLAKPDQPTFVELSEQSLAKIRDIVNEEVTLILQSQEYAEIKSIVESLSREAEYYGYLLDEQNQIDYLVEELVPRALQAAEHRTFQLNTPWAQANYALAVTYAMIINTMGQLINEEVDKQQISREGAKNIIDNYNGRLHSMESTIKWEYKQRYPILMHPSNCAYRSPIPPGCFLQINRRVFYFRDGSNAMMEALTYQHELINADWAEFDPEDMVNITQRFLGGLRAKFSE